MQYVERNLHGPNQNFNEIDKGAVPRKIFQHLRFISQKEVLQTADQISPVTMKQNFNDCRVEF